MANPTPQEKEPIYMYVVGLMVDILKKNSPF
jgi:hypothetical protein